jgi:hypothetical protein
MYTFQRVSMLILAVDPTLTSALESSAKVGDVASVAALAVENVPTEEPVPLTPVSL